MITAVEKSHFTERKKSFESIQQTRQESACSLPHNHSFLYKCVIPKVEKRILLTFKTWYPTGPPLGKSALCEFPILQSLQYSTISLRKYHRSKWKWEKETMKTVNPEVKKTSNTSTQSVSTYSNLESVDGWTRQSLWTSQGPTEDQTTMFHSRNRQLLWPSLHLIKTQTDVCISMQSA